MSGNLVLKVSACLMAGVLAMIAARFAECVRTTDTVSDRSSGAMMLNVRAWPSDHTPTARRVASASR